MEKTKRNARVFLFAAVFALAVGGTSGQRGRAPNQKIAFPPRHFSPSAVLGIAADLPRDAERMARRVSSALSQ